MYLGIQDDHIPGTTMLRSDMGNVTGLEFLNKIFFITDGIMLAQIREISGVDGSTLQNWVKRGWVAQTVNKKYSKEHLSRILIINMLRGTMLLERIDFLLRYINGSVNCREDDIIPESQLYDYICRIICSLTGEGANGERADERLRECIEYVTADYVERINGAGVRLRRALEIIVTAYYAQLIASYSNKLFEEL
ncbi:MAG: DUF1836 domain-containing protein [Eubacteriales bacterium]